MRKIILLFSIVVFICSTTVQFGANSQFAHKFQPTGELVLICVSPNAVAYHAYMCRGLSKCTHKIEKVTAQDAINKGYRACKICY